MFQTLIMVLVLIKEQNFPPQLVLTSCVFLCLKIFLKAKSLLLVSKRKS